MPIRLKPSLLPTATTCALLLAVPTAHALSADDHPGFYLAGFGLYEFADSARQSENGYGFQATIGRGLSAHSALEFSVLNLRRDRDIDGRGDYKTAFSLDYVRDFGLKVYTPAGIPPFKPYLLGSIGGVLEDVRGDTHLHPALNLGGGLLWPLRFGTWDWGWGLRTEVKGLIQYNDRESAPANEDWLFDAHLLVGLSIPLRRPPAAMTPASAPDCELTIVDPVSGRRDCVADSDHDGIADADDQCPATPVGEAVDARGCSGAAGPDADGDGVLDGSDRCPATMADRRIDADGCAIAQDFSLPALTFETDSAVLTGAATRVLDELAAMLAGQAGATLEIAGHTDDVGDAAYNLTLSTQRAKSVREYLALQGVETERMQAVGYGADRPLAANDSDENRARNRRVELRLMP